MLEGLTCNGRLRGPIEGLYEDTKWTYHERQSKRTASLGTGGLPRPTTVWDNSGASYRDSGGHFGLIGVPRLLWKGSFGTLESPWRAGAF